MSEAASKAKSRQKKTAHRKPVAKRDPSKILLAMSGGNDSAVAAALLQSQGFEVIGVFFELISQQKAESPAYATFKPRCFKADEKPRFEMICKKLGLTAHVISVADLYEQEVIDFYVHETLSQHFPNLCSRCHVQVRMHSLLKAAERFNCGKLATGHFARVNLNNTTGNYHLSRAATRNLDQSFLLHGLTQEILSQLIFPLGALSANLIDKLSIQLELGARIQNDGSVHRGLCLEKVSEDPLQHPAQFIEAHVPPLLRLPGLLHHKKEGVLLGEHKGLHFFRIGQSTGFKLNQERKDSLRVVGFEPKSNNVYLGPEADLFHSKCILSEVNWIIPTAGIQGQSLDVQFHPSEEPIPARLTVFENDRVLVELSKPKRLLQCGQVGVFYHGDEVMGGGWVRQILD